MKDKRFDNTMIPLDEVSPELIEVISLATDKEYGEALEIIDEYISQVEDAEQKNIAAMISLQILALAGYNEISSILLKALLKKFNARSKARNLCKRTINNL